jgi:hypothetical protein
MIHRRRRPAITLPGTLTAAAQRGLVALGFIAGLIAIGIGAASTAWSSPLLPVFEACCLYPIIVVVILELRPAVIALRGERRAIRHFRRQLDALPALTQSSANPATPRSSSNRSGRRRVTRVPPWRSRQMKARPAARLDLEDHAILAMRVAGDSLVEIAKTLGVPEPAIANRIAAIVAKLELLRRAP